MIRVLEEIKVKVAKTILAAISWTPYLVCVRITGLLT